ncbi:hypothetical protein [Scytonema sp. NUACC26]|uniref:hypothetical protein n=1 Tax=Scytonema sp. NUACC26 TaxID=3140176 RepID=UPI0034DC9152
MTTNNVEKIRALAAEYLTHFEQLTHENREYHSNTFWVTKQDTRPEELQDLIREAHGDMFPDDWKYDFIFDALNTIVDSETDDLEDLGYEIEGDIYNRDLLNWLASNLTRSDYVNEFVESYGVKSSNFDLMGIVRHGQVEEKREVYNSVLQSLQKLIDEIEDDESDEEIEDDEY